MAIPKDQIKKLKEQLLTQLDSTNLPNKEEIKTSVEAMDAEELEEFLIQNNLIPDQSQPQQTGQPKCVFCSIVFGEIPSTKIAENEKAIAILEINPISQGHTIIIPKEHIEKLIWLFILHFLKIMGFAPLFGRCAACGKDRLPDGRVVVSPLSGTHPSACGPMTIPTSR